MSYGMTTKFYLGKFQGKRWTECRSGGQDGQAVRTAAVRTVKHGICQPADLTVSSTEVRAQRSTH